MTDAAHLIELIRQVREGTLRLLEAADETWLTWAPPGTSNHILWHAGHALWLADVLAIEPITGRSELPDGWAERFGMNCHPVAQTRTWPSRAEILQRLSAQQQRLCEVIGGLPPAQLALPEPARIGRRDLVRSLIHALHDEARHQGEMYLLLKLRRAREAAGV